MSETLIDGVLFREFLGPGPLPLTDRAIVFVHGYTGDADSTWRARNAQLSFYELLASDPAFYDHHVLRFQYQSKKLRPPAIPNIADQLIQALVGLPYRRIIYIAHSMGGLVVMHAILRSLEKGKTGNVAGLLLYGVPMSGVEWLKFARSVLTGAELVYPHVGLVSKFIGGNKQLAALTEDSEFIESLTGRWAWRVLNGGDPGIATAQRAFFPVRVITGNDDWVVKESSARGLYAEIDWENADQDHINLVKPSSFQAPTYLSAARFIQESKSWISPALLVKLRTQMDQIWEMRKEETISNWIFDLEFDNSSAATVMSGERGNNLGAGLVNFSIFRVTRCEYVRKIPQPVLKFGFAVGHILADSVWTNNFVFLHRCNMSALPSELSNRLQNTIRELLRTMTAEVAWGRLFDEVRLVVHDLATGVRHELHPGVFTRGDFSLIRDYTLPEDANHLVGKEATIEVSFSSVMPTASCDYTASFPWLCDGFRFNVFVQGEPRYLLHSVGLRGAAAIQVNREHQSRLQCSSEDLILPGSTLQFEWRF
ncbi:alpha/beta fold hydrolase [Tunturiibacter gelidoferens]|uniref:Alpha/beta fold hydrolase n=1 Tax=Tunturiibacter gelidiferens TaxID=3069689 RepID=A0AAU7YXL2_9BACT